MSVEVRLTVGPYLVGQRLGVGGMGEVYVAVEQAVTKVPVALKLLLPHLTHDTAAVQMFLDEARLVARMNHPNLVRVHDVGMDDGRLYLAMDLVKGVPLSALIRALIDADREPSPAVVLHVARSLCEGLHHAHEQRTQAGEALEIVHRDVSPQNLLVSQHGEVKLTDFGIAQARVTHRKTTPGIVRGKVEYLAPEQAKGGSVDRRADLFSAAATIAHFATLSSPFRRDGVKATLAAIEHDSLPSLRALRPDLPPALCEALSVASRKDPATRYRSARELLDALPAAPEGALELAALVQQLCRDAVDEVDVKTAATVRLGTHTEESSAPVPLPEGHRITAKVGVEPRGPTQPISLELTAFPRVTAPSPRPPRRRFGRLRQVAIGAWLLVVALVVAIVMKAGAGPEPAAAAPVAEASEPVMDFAEPEVAAEQAEVAATLAEVEPQPAGVSESARPPRRRKAAPPPPPPQPSKPRLGYLTVDAEPWAEVYVRGRLLGETPLATVPIESGQVMVQLKTPTTGRIVTRVVTVSAGKETFLKENLP